MVISYHTNTWGCGIAKFNAILAEKLKIRLISFHDWASSRSLKGFLSISLNEFSELDKRLLLELISSRNDLTLILHSFSFDPIEIEIIKKINAIIALNKQIVSNLTSIGIKCIEAHAPSMLQEKDIGNSSFFKLFTFGMAHKFELASISKVVQNYRSLGENPSIIMSTALHVGEQPIDHLQEKVESLSRELETPVYFLGFLSDIALQKEIKSADAVFRFFPGGVRSNSTSLMTALKLGKVTITNLDEYSPFWMRHFENVVDISLWSKEQRIPHDLGAHAAASYVKHAGWDKFIEVLP